VPFHDLLLQRIDVSEAAFERVDITHQWASVAANPPFVFRYWRPIIQELSLLGFAYFTAVHYSAARPRLQKRNSVGLLLLFGFTAYCMVFTLEKATLIYLVWCYFLIRHMIDPRRVLKRMVFLSVTVLALCCVMLVVFMGVETLPDTLSAIWFRMQGQTASVYVQNEYIMSHGFLGLHGIHMPVLSSLLGADYYVNLPGYAYEVLLPELSANGRVGSAAGFSIAELYFAFGWWGAALFGVVVTAYGFLDQVILNSCQEASLGIRERAINVGFYAATSSWYSLLLVGSVLGILSFPFVCSETFFFFLAGYLLVMKVHGIKMRSVAARWRLLGRDARSPLAGGADA
jgi:hypothetical protein